MLVLILFGEGDNHKVFALKFKPLKIYARSLETLKTDDLCGQGQI